MDSSPKCRVCGMEEEAHAHTVLRCSRWRRCRASLDDLAVDVEALPPFTRHCGIIQGDPRLQALRNQLMEEGPLSWPEPAMMQDPEEDGNMVHKYVEDGRVIWMIASDGACTNSRHPDLAREGQWVHSILLFTVWGVFLHLEIRVYIVITNHF